MKRLSRAFQTITGTENGNTMDERLVIVSKPPDFLVSFLFFLGSISLLETNTTTFCCNSVMLFTSYASRNVQLHQNAVCGQTFLGNGWFLNGRIINRPSDECVLWKQWLQGRECSWSKRMYGLGEFDFRWQVILSYVEYIWSFHFIQEKNTAAEHEEVFTVTHKYGFRENEK